MQNSPGLLSNSDSTVYMWRDTNDESLVGGSNYILEFFFCVEFDHFFTPSL